MDEITILQQRVDKLERIINEFTRTDKYVFERPIYGGTKGLKLGETGKKIGFFGIEPVVQYPTALNSTASSSYGGNEQNIINVLRAGLISYNLFHS